MSNYVVLNDGTDYGNKTGRIASVVQGEVGKVLLIDVQDQAGNDFSITGATSFVGRMESAAGAVTTVTGTITVSSGGLSWDMSSGDVGTAGRFSVLVQFTLNGDIYKTHPVTLNIIADPASTTVQGDTNVTIPQTEATWLTAEKAATETAAAGEILEGDGDNSQGSGYQTATSLRKHNFTATAAPTVNDDTGDGYEPGSYWVDTVGGAIYFCWDASLGAAEWEDVTAASGISNVVEDTTPELGGDLDAQGNDITDMGDITFKTGASGGTLRTGTANADKFILAAYDVNDGVYRTVIELDAGNDVVMQLIADYLAMEDAADTTKHVEWDISGATTGTATTLIFSQTANRNITFPDETGTILTNQGGTLAGGLNMADNLITRPKFTDYGETLNALGALGGGTVDIDITLGNVVSGTVDTSTTTFTFSNPSASGTACSFSLRLENGGSQTINWPASVQWAGGTAPTLTAAGVDWLTFVTLDGGTTWDGFAAGLDMQ